MKDMIAFAMEKHWHEHTGLPQMTEVGCLVSDDETCLLHQFECHMCNEIVQISEPVNIDRGNHGSK